MHRLREGLVLFEDDPNVFSLGVAGRVAIVADVAWGTSMDCMVAPLSSGLSVFGTSSLHRDNAVYRLLLHRKEVWGVDMP